MKCARDAHEIFTNRLLESCVLGLISSLEFSTPAHN